jgi:hypothetical protein
MLATAKRQSESTLASIAGSQHRVFLFSVSDAFSTHTCQKKSNIVWNLGAFSCIKSNLILIEFLKFYRKVTVTVINYHERSQIKIQGIVKYL